MSGSATFATDRFRLATAATRMSESRTSPDFSGPVPAFAAAAGGGGAAVVVGLVTRSPGRRSDGRSGRYSGPQPSARRSATDDALTIPTSPCARPFPPARRRVARLARDGSPRHRAARLPGRARRRGRRARPTRIGLGRRAARLAASTDMPRAAATRPGPAARSSCRPSTPSSRGSAGSARRPSTTSASGWPSRRPRRTASRPSTPSSRRTRGRRWWPTSATTSPAGWPARKGCART